MKLNCLLFTKIGDDDDVRIVKKGSDKFLILYLQNREKTNFSLIIVFGTT